MNLFHLVLSNASPFATFQLYPSFCISSSVVSFLVVLGLPLFLVPWGFHSNACLSITPCGFYLVCGQSNAIFSPLFVVQ